MTTVTEYLDNKIEQKSSVFCAHLNTLNAEANILPNVTVAAKGVCLSPNNPPLAVYSGSLLSSMGVPTDDFKEHDSICFMFESDLSMDDVCLATWQWQKSFDGKASAEGVVEHLREEIEELSEVIDNRLRAAGELADIFILAIHCAALLDLDPATIIADKLAVNKQRSYTVEQDGKIKHE